MRRYKFKVFRDAKGEYRFNMIAPNGRIILASEGYKRKVDAINTIRTIKQKASNAPIEIQQKIVEEENLLKKIRRYLSRVDP